MSVPSDRWDLTSYFPSFDSTEREAFEAALARDVRALEEEAAKLPSVGEGADAAWVACLGRYERTLAADSHLGSYVGCLASADAADERFTLAEAGAKMHGVAVDLLLEALNHSQALLLAHAGQIRRY